MLSVVGEEYIAYSESVKGQYSPMVAIQKYDGTMTYREIVKEDLLRIKDDQTVPGGWIFRKSQSTAASWVKRFALARGAFVFLFHSPQNEKPIAVIPLEDCTLVAPEAGQKTFDEMRSYKANEGFEFDIRHNSRSTVRLYTLSEQERLDWMATCRTRIEAAATQKAVNGNTAPVTGTGNIIVSSTKLTGLSLLPTTTASTSTAAASPYVTTASTLPPLPNEPYPFGNTQTNFSAASYPYSQNTSASVAPQRSLSPGGVPYRGGPQSVAPSGPVRMAPGYGGGSVYGGASVVSGYPGPSVAGGNPNRPSIFSTSASAAGAGNGAGRQSAPYLAPQKTAQTIGLSKFRSRKDLGFEFVLLEENLKKKLADQLEARNRESAAKTRLYDKDTIAVAQEKENENPLTLAEMFRQMLCFVDEEVAEDPQEGTQLQLPHLKGQAVEEMMNAVYRRYCGPSGFMSLEQFIEFFEDSAILQTHAPHNDNDEPVEEYVTLLDPVRLLTLVPRNIGFSVAETYDTVNASLAAAVKQDKFTINFSQFYMLLLRMTQIVYADLFEKDSTVAFNKILQEVICPLFVWCKGHHKRGSRDVLVLEERIALLMITYAPNLYRVFLTYAHDAVGKVPEINRLFPESAQANERGMFKLPPVAPQHQIDSSHHTADSIFITESGALRFARDYGITPYVSSIRQIKEIYKSVNRNKVIVSSRLPTRDMVNKAQSAAQTHSKDRKKEPPNFKVSTKPTGFGSSSAKDGSKGTASTATTTAAGAAAGTPRKAAAAKVGSPPRPLRAESPGADGEGDEDAPPPPSAAPVIGGIGFSEFIEFIARVAVEGMQQENYDVVFPTPFSKVLAMLTVWGVADMRKLEEVRIIHTEEVYQ